MTLASRTAEALRKLEMQKEAAREALEEAARGCGRSVSRRPCCHALFWTFLVLALTILGAIAYPPEIETDFSSFQTTDVESSVMLSAFKAADRARESASRRLQADSDEGAMLYVTKELILVYELDAQHPAGLFRGETMQRIADFEEGLRSLGPWQNFCDKSRASRRDLCLRGVSVAQHALPTQNISGGFDVVPSSLLIDGGGSEALGVDAVLALLARSGSESVVLPGEEAAGPVLAARSVFRFEVPCCSADSTLAEQRSGAAEVAAEWRSLFRDSIRPYVRGGVAPPARAGAARGAEGRGGASGIIKVWYEGSDVEQSEVLIALRRDTWHAAGSLVMVHLYVLVHTRSFLLCLAGPLIAILAVPLTYVACACFFGATTVSFTSFLALFLVVGFGADVVFVYTDFWNSSKQHRENDEDRVVWTYGCAAKASFATTATTALSFLANLASAIRALRQFAFFMGLCVMLAWLLVSLIYLPLCLVDERSLSYWRVCGRQRASWAGPWTRHVWRWRRWYVGLCAACSVAGLAASVPQLALSTEVPSIFPEGHNMNGVSAAMEPFAPLPSGIVVPAKEEPVCPPSAPDTSECALLWCEAAPDPAAGAQSCASQDRQSGGAGVQDTCSPNFSTAAARLRFAGVPSMTKAEAQAAAMGVARARFGNGSFRFAVGGIQLAESVPRLMLHDWESGAMQLSTVLEVDGFLIREGAGGTGDGSRCDWEVLTFCGGGLECKAGGPWADVGATPPLGLDDASGRRLLPAAAAAFPPAGRDGRWLAASSSLPLAKQAKVVVAFGLTVPTGVPLLGAADPAANWGFLDTFQAADPWAQRDMYRFCSEQPAELKVTRGWCWMTDFRSFVRSSTDYQFPVRATEFDALAEQFYASSKSTSGSRYIWRRGGKIKAMYFSFRVNVPSQEMGSRALDLKARWDAHLQQFDESARSSAKGAFHVAELWVNAESRAVLLTTTAQTLGILLVLAFLGMLTFTWSVTLSVYVVLATVCVIAGLVFVIVVLMGWEIGLIEVIAIVYFVGYAVTYSLHIAHKYSHAKLEDGLDDEPFVKPMEDERARIRYARTLYSLQALGGAAVGSAATTMLASFFLLFCTLTIFVKLGGMCLAVSLLSLATALCPLPAALMMVGPVGQGGCCGGFKARMNRVLQREEDSTARARE